MGILVQVHGGFSSLSHLPSVITSAKGEEVMCLPCKYVCWFVVVEGTNLSMKHVSSLADMWDVFKPSKDLW